MTVRVLYLVPDLFGRPGGIARYCQAVSRALSLGSAHVSVLSLNDSVNTVADWAYIGEAKYRPCGGNRPKFVTEALCALGAKPHLVVIAHPNFAPLGWLLARLSRAKLIVFMYGVDVWKPLPSLRRWALRRSDVWIAISRFTAERAAEANGLPLENIHILHNCLDPKFECASQPVESKEPHSLLTVARLSRSASGKGHGQVMKALPTLLERFPKLVYHIVGDGDMRHEMEMLAKRDGIAHAVRFHGLVSDEELAHRYAAAAVFIMPSRQEGFGFVFIEAMAHGTPVIGGTLDAASEVIIHGETGCLVDPMSTEDIVEAATWLLADPKRCLRMGQAARHDVRERFGFHVFQRQLLSHLGIPH